MKDELERLMEAEKTAVAECFCLPNKPCLLHQALSSLQSTEAEVERLREELGRREVVASRADRMIRDLQQRITELEDGLRESQSWLEVWASAVADYHLAERLDRNRSLLNDSQPNREDG